MAVARRVPFCALLVPWALLASGCVSLTGELLLQPVEKDIEMGKEYGAQMADQVGVVADPALEEYVAALGKRVAENIDDKRFPFTFQILDQDEPNAFALPGGPTFVSRGLLAIARREDELAGVIGHELIHVTERHSAQQLAKERVPNLLKLPGRVVGRVVSQDLGRLLNAPVSTVGAVFSAKYSRGQESESDDLGLEAAAKTGYDPKALAEILKRMERSVEARSGGPRRATFFDSHPSTPDRIADIQKRATDLERTYGAPRPSNRAEFLARLDGLVLGENPAIGVFRGQRFLHPELDLTLEFPKGWKTVNTPRAAGGTAPEGNAVAFLGVHGKGEDPKAAASELTGSIEKEYRLRPNRSEAVSVGSWPGYVVTFQDISDRPAMDLHILWFAKGGTIYQLIGIAPESKKSELRATAESLRPLTAEERGSFTVTRLRIVEAQEGESLERVAKRTGNQWSPSTLEIYNGMPSTKALQAGDRIKVAVQERWVSSAGGTVRS